MIIIVRHVCICVYIYIYIYIERERERDSQIDTSTLHGKFRHKESPQTTMNIKPDRKRCTHKPEQAN